MYIVNAGIGCLFLILTVVHVIGVPSIAGESQYHPLCTAMLALSTLLAFLTLKHQISLPMSRFLAVVTVVAMFFYFAGFFSLVPHFQEGWYRGVQALDAVSLLLAAFFMIPVLSDFSCRLKAECRETRHMHRRSFFSAPRHLEKHTPAPH